MSQENIELVRQALQAFDRRDLTSWLALVDEDAEVVPTREWPEPGARGAETSFNWLVDIFDSLRPIRTADAEVIDAGADKVLLHYRIAVTGKESDARVDVRRWVVVTMRNGRILRIQWFGDRAEALGAAGLKK